MDFTAQPYPLCIADWNDGSVTYGRIIGWHDTGENVIDSLHGDYVTLSPVVLAHESDRHPIGGLELWKLNEGGP